MPKHIEFCLVLSRFSFFYVQILTQNSADSQAACYIFFQNFELFCQIYLGLDHYDHFDHYVDQYQFLMGYFSLSFYPIKFKPRHNDP